MVEVDHSGSPSWCRHRYYVGEGAFMPAGSINKKEIHDFIADTINTNGYQRRTLWSDAETRQALLVEVFAIEPGNDTGVHYHWDRVEMIVCMRGRGKVTIA